jgi:hypothetical protein
MPDEPVAAVDPPVYTIKEFCREHRLGHSLYHQLKAEGRGPAEIKLGRKTLISREAAARWRAARGRDGTPMTRLKREAPPRRLRPNGSGPCLLDAPMKRAAFTGLTDRPERPMVTVENGPSCTALACRRLRSLAGVKRKSSARSEHCRF